MILLSLNAVGMSRISKSDRRREVAAEGLVRELLRSQLLFLSVERILLLTIVVFMHHVSADKYIILQKFLAVEFIDV